MPDTASAAIREMIQSREADRLSLHERYLNPKAVGTGRKLGTGETYVRASGAYLETATGERVLDLDGGSGVFNIGRNNPRAREMLAQVLALEGPNMVGRHLSLMAGLLAEALVRSAPAGLDRVMFTTTGSETTELALKIARSLTRRPRLLYMEGGFHGVTYGALSVTDADFAREGVGPMLPGCDRVARNDIDALRRELGRGDVAGLIVEPIQGLDVTPIGRDFISAAHELCGRHGTVLIADEVFTGLGRTGKTFACEHWGLTPDLLLVAKSLSAGYVPVGAVLMRGELHDKLYAGGGFFHGSTFEHNELAMTAGVATMRILDDDKLVERSAAMGKAIIDGLRRIQVRYDMIADVRGQGLLVGIELRAPSSLRLRISGRMLEKRGLLGHMLMMQLLSKHSILATAVARNNILRLTPPLIITEAEVDKFLTAMEAVLKASYRFPDGIAGFLLGRLLKMARER